LAKEIEDNPRKMFMMMLSFLGEAVPSILNPNKMIVNNETKDATSNDMRYFGEIRIRVQFTSTAKKMARRTSYLQRVRQQLACGED
jgi:hypothetical protein